MLVRAGDTRLFVEVVGTRLVPDGPAMRARPTVVCLHGGPGFDHVMSRHWLEPLADVAQLVFYDHRGQGRSDAVDPSQWRLDVWIDDVAALIDTLGIEKPVLIGQSFGGVVALGAAARYPDLPGKLVASSTFARFRRDRSLAKFAELGGQEARAVAEAFFDDPSEENRVRYFDVCLPLYNRTRDDPDVVARVVARHEIGRHFFAGEGATFDLTDEIRAITCPTLVLSGALDPITTVEDGEDVARAVPGARHLVFPACGHGVFRDEPGPALAALREFIQA